MKGENYDWYLCKQHSVELRNQVGGVLMGHKVKIVTKDKCEQCRLLKLRSRLSSTF